MGKDIPLGRIAGVRVGMNVTVFLMAGVYTLFGATSIFPDAQPGMSDASYWVAGVAGALFLFISLLVHEAGHALVARDEGIGVLGMELTVFGGVTRMESSPTTPGAEFRVSVVGPIASAACGVVFLVGSTLIPDGGAWGLAGAVFAFAGVINLFLAVVNMVPAAPLDGGKVLSSIIWRATGSQSTAMAWAAGAGVVVGMAMAAWGLREVLDGRYSGASLTFLLIGGFIALSAVQQLRTAPLFRALDGLTVQDMAALDPPTAPAWATVGEFLRATDLRPEHQAYPMVEPDGRVSGLLTAAAIRATPPDQWDRLAVTALAFPMDRLTVVSGSEQLLGALQKLEGGDVRIALVAGSDGRVIGTIDSSAVDHALARARAERQPSRV